MVIFHSFLYVYQRLFQWIIGDLTLDHIGLGVRVIWVVVFWWCFLYDFHLGGVVESDCFSACAPCIWEDAHRVPIGFDIVGIIVDTFQKLRTRQNQRMCSVWSCLPALCHCMLLCKLTCQTRCAIGSKHLAVRMSTLCYSRCAIVFSCSNHPKYNIWLHWDLLQCAQRIRWNQLPKRSLRNMCPMAQWCFDMFWLTSRGMPDLTRLLCPWRCLTFDGYAWLRTPTQYQ